MAESVPEAVELVADHGHDIGCHGYDHFPNRASDSMNFNEQVAELAKAKAVIEDIEERISDFRGL
jgi:peptidoglycan/xylan/chitin deacetylase (PgdA/CDA1 family)